MGTRGIQRIANSVVDETQQNQQPNWSALERLLHPEGHLSSAGEGSPRELVNSVPVVEPVPPRELRLFVRARDLSDIASSRAVNCMLASRKIDSNPGGIS